MKMSANKQANGQTKVGRVIQLAQRKSGTTIKEIAKQLKISSTAASSLVADARRNHRVKIKCKDGVYRA